MHGESIKEETILGKNKGDGFGAFGKFGKFGNWRLVLVIGTVEMKCHFDFFFFPLFLEGQSDFSFSGKNCWAWKSFLSTKPIEFFKCKNSISKFLFIKIDR